MYKKRHRISIWIIVLCWLIALIPPQAVNAAEYVMITQDTTARVIQVIDGDAIKVSLPDDGGFALVRLAGITTQGNSEAYAYLTEALLGQSVEIKIDSAWSSGSGQGRWTPAYVYKGSTFYNRVLLQKGLALTDAAYRGYSQYAAFLMDEKGAINKNVGLWTTSLGLAIDTMTTTQSRVNMNTATEAQLQSYFKCLNTAEARAIVAYREDSPFLTVREVKFAGVFSRDEFENYFTLMSVCTNINTASVEELRRLPNITAAEAKSIITYRSKTPFYNTAELHRKGIITSAKFNEIEPYISVYDIETLDYAHPHTTAFLNQASVEKLRDAGIVSGLTASYARVIVKAREDGYSYKSLGEIQKIKGISLTTDQINGLADNLLMDSRYDALRIPAYININTASYDTLLNTGFTRNQVSLITNLQSSQMRSGMDIPFNLGELDSLVTLYTNINATTETELCSLSSNMTPYFASVLINAAASQPFGTMEELSQFFTDHNEAELYRAIREYLVLR